jgi:hypothetical protein
MTDAVPDNNGYDNGDLAGRGQAIRSLTDSIRRALDVLDTGRPRPSWAAIAWAVAHMPEWLATRLAEEED